ncbi:hypothetical protein PRZ48_009046 [Zasmidium cellare]|uniref:Uncharacterized protein n=1 Tax=Zasmidium cellare TaxID=395010 RepID=A0ABR0EH65_ZASCE|nr:hypothetical protein PRZ48_009046 [Zasmidium cellare]
MRLSQFQKAAVALSTLFVLFADVANSTDLLKQSCINEACSAVRLTIHNPPVNLFDINLITSLDTYLNSLKNQTQTKVVVVSSDVPGFFGAHLDLNLLSNVTRPGINASQYVDTYSSNIDLLLDLPVIFIGEINGRTWGAGNENAVRYDMRFAGPDAIFGAPEAAGGLLHYGETRQLVQLIGPGLATEFLLGATEITQRKPRGSDGSTQHTPRRKSYESTSRTLRSALREHMSR